MLSVSGLWMLLLLTGDCGTRSKGSLVLFFRETESGENRRGVTCMSPLHSSSGLILQLYIEESNLLRPCTRNVA